jgi:hypothetical protein
MLFMVFVFAIGFGFVVLALVRLSGGRGSGGDEGHGDDGPWWRRGGGPRPTGPRPRSPEPTWWPEFEREFRLYAKSHPARRKVSGVGS